MELVRHTIEFIKRKPYGNKLLIKVKDEVKLVIDATPGYEPYDRQKIIEQNKRIPSATLISESISHYKGCVS